MLVTRLEIALFLNSQNNGYCNWGVAVNKYSNSMTCLFFSKVNLARLIRILLYVYNPELFLNVPFEGQPDHAGGCLGLSKPSTILFLIVLF